MFEFQIVVEHKGKVLLTTEWRVGPQEARNTAWLLAGRLGEEYVVTIKERREVLRATPWHDFALDLMLHAA